MVELPRQSRRLQGKPPEYTSSQLEGLKAVVVPHTISRIRSTETRESSIITHPNYHEINQTTEYIQEPIAISEVTGITSPTSELAEEPEISELDTKPAILEPSSGFVTPTSSHPDSPKVRHRIIENIPSDLLSIEEIIGSDEEVI